MILPNPASSALQLRLLIVDDDIGLLDAMKRSLKESVQTVVACDSFERARQKLKDQPFDALITDVGWLQWPSARGHGPGHVPEHAAHRVFRLRRSGVRIRRRANRGDLPGQARCERGTAEAP